MSHPRTPIGFVRTAGKNAKPWQLQYRPTYAERQRLLGTVLERRADRLVELSERKHCGPARQAKLLKKLDALTLNVPGATAEMQP